MSLHEYKEAGKFGRCVIEEGHRSAYATSSDGPWALFACVSGCDDGYVDTIEEARAYVAEGVKGPVLAQGALVARSHLGHPLSQLQGANNMDDSTATVDKHTEDSTDGFITPKEPEQPRSIRFIVAVAAQDRNKLFANTKSQSQFYRLVKAFFGEEVTWGMDAEGVFQLKYADGEVAGSGKTFADVLVAATKDLSPEDISALAGPELVSQLPEKVRQTFSGDNRRMRRAAKVPTKMHEIKALEEAAKRAAEATA